MQPKQDTYPVFEANQVLTNRHLNQVFDYLDEQERLTRANLIGIGIVCGLEIKLTTGNASVLLSKGCGVTSEGYLIVEPAEEVALVEYKTYTLPDEVTEYLPFKYDAPDPNDNTKIIRKQYDLWELFEAGEPNSTKLTDAPGNFLNDKAVLLFLELKKDGLRNCSPNNCDDKGAEVTATVRRLLVRVADLTKIIAKAGGFSSGLSTSEVSSLLTARLDLPDLRLRRLDVPRTGLKNTQEIFAAYQNVLLENNSASNSDSLFEHVEKALSKAYVAFRPLVHAFAQNDPFVGALAFKEKTYRKSKATADIVYSQYYYDFLDDLIQAYDEFRWKGLDLLAMCCPPADLFPRHLMLGEIVGSDKAGKKVFRHYFRPSAAQVAQAKLCEEVKHLFQRLVLMVKKFDLPTEASEIRITPSRLGALPLSQKAIPFHYRVNEGAPALYSRWSFDKTNAGRANQNLSYYAEEYATQEFVKNPLEYDLEPNNFFRIEGHIGMSWQSALKNLLDAIQTHRLPFDVIALNADNLVVENDPQPARCGSDGLEVIYKIWVNEMNCLLGKKIKYLTSYDYNNLTYQPKSSASAVSKRSVAAAMTDVVLGSEATGSFVVDTVKYAPALALIKPPAVSLNIVDSASKYEGSIGKAYTKVLADPKTTTSNDLKVGIEKDIKMSAKVNDLSTKDYQIVVNYPVELLAAMYDFAKTVPDVVENIKYLDIREKYENIRDTAFAYVEVLKELPSDYAYFTPKEKEDTIAELNDLLGDCLYERLEELAKELEKRKKAVENLLFFSEYVKKHPSIQHKAGVPLGGTFILAYHGGEEKIPVVEGNFKLIGIVSSNGIPQVGASVIEKKTAKGVVTKAGGKFNISVTQLPAILIISGINFQQIEWLAVDEDDLQEIDVSKPVVSPKSVLKPDTVIADFYLPYRCCSDCPSPQFVLPLPKPVFTAQAGCGIKDGKVPVDITVLHGTAPYSLKVDEGNPIALDKFDGLTVGPHSLVLSDHQGGESLPVSIVIDPPMPCLGEAVRCNYRFWIPIPKPQENKRLNKYSAKVNEFTFEGRDKEIIDIKGEVQAIFNASKDKEDELNGNFESFVKAWMVLINQKIAEKVGSNDWLKLEYIHDDIKGVGQLRVERFDCLIFNFDLSVSYNHPASTETYELRYSVDGLSITAKGDDPVFFPPVDCETLNKCNKETTWQPRCIPKSFELNIVEKNAEGSKLSLKAASSDINPSLFVWEVAEAKPSIANGSSVSMLLSEPIPKLIHIQVTAFDQDGCSVTIKDTLQFPQ